MLNIMELLQNFWQLSRESTMLVSELWIDKVQNPKRTWVISSENAV